MLKAIKLSQKKGFKIHPYRLEVTKWLAKEHKISPKLLEAAQLKGVNVNDAVKANEAIRNNGVLKVRASI